MPWIGFHVNNQVHFGLLLEYKVFAIVIKNWIWSLIFFAFFFSSIQFFWEQNKRKNSEEILITRLAKCVRCQHDQNIKNFWPKYDKKRTRSVLILKMNENRYLTASTFAKIVFFTKTAANGHAMNEYIHQNVHTYNIQCLLSTPCDIFSTLQ